MSTNDELPRGEIARWALADELLGPSREPSEAELAERTAGLGDLEARDMRRYFTWPRSARQQRFRANLDDLRTPFMSAGRALAAAGVRVPSWGALDDVMEGLQMSGRADVGDALGAVEALRGTLDTLVEKRYAALGDLPWGRAWILDLLDQPDSAEGTFTNGRLPEIRSGGSVWTEPRVILDLSELDLGSLAVPSVASRERQRDLLRERVSSVLGEQWGIPDRNSRVFTRRLLTDPVAVQAMAAIERQLDVTHPQGTRPYALSAVSQIRRDVALWARIRIDGIPAEQVAEEHQLQAGMPSIAGPEQSTRQGVRKAASRAAVLLGDRRRPADPWTAGGTI